MYQLAQLNIARMKLRPGHRGMKDFNDALEPVNSAAESSPGFVWRLVSSENDSPELMEFESQGWLVNMSVWQSMDEFRAFFSSGLHLSIMRRRAEWFEKTKIPTTVLWWIEAGHVPTFAEAMQRLEHLRRNGPSASAFLFSTPFDSPS